MNTSGVPKLSPPTFLRKASKDLLVPPLMGARPKASKSAKANNSPGLIIKVLQESPSATPLSSPALFSVGTNASTRRPLPRVPSVASLHSTPPPTPPSVAGSSSCHARPLPRPPSSSSSSDDRYSEDESEDSDISSSVTPAKSIPVTATPLRTVKPLPVPINCTAVTPRQTGRKIPSKSLPLFDDAREDALNGLTPKWSCMARSHTPPILSPISTLKRISLDISTRTPLGWESKPSSKDSCPIDSIPRFVLDFSRMPLSDVSDAVSEGSEYDLHGSIEPRYHDDVDYHRLPLNQIDDHSHEDQDYTWELQDDVLYQRKVHDVPVSKWYTEKKGKRTTERDYENIRNALRCL
ncbi:hypothetical protein CPB83DRAFT_850502 [Crepidotus variabilis]|uniref:Uncharacterized protein n=1 Tax=Crepidotus variabilis TaxID=179855 RepID=A0A9P6JS50_9AGAR|nr:hypothetical protein CPB83DRAFT_850502 [Crepidotus variabilis]